MFTSACFSSDVYCAKRSTFREDDVSWPKKNIVGRQELEVRVDKEHISFEVRGPSTGLPR